MWTRVDAQRGHRQAGLRGRALPALALALLGASATGWAQDPASADRIYDVELVIFRNLDASSYSTPEVDPVRDPDDPSLGDELAPLSRDAAPPTVNQPALARSADSRLLPDGYTELPPDRRTLGAIEAALKRSAGYRPIAYIGWSQPAMPRGSAPAVSLDGQLAGTGLTGTAQLGVGRFLHLDLELDYQTQDGRVRQIVQSRRMRNGERHYLDDPEIGAIVTVNRREATR